MTPDWADKIARELSNRELKSVEIKDCIEEAIQDWAAALRTARADALEEAAKVAEGPKKINQLRTDGRDSWIPDSTYGIARADAATAIRAMKEKENG